MKKRTWYLLLAALAMVFVLAACGSTEEESAETDTETTTEGSDTEATEADTSESTEAMDDTMAEMPDLGGREVTIAVENAYLPFNYISLETGEPAGWDYDAWDAICGVLNCTPVYVTAGWDGMIQAVADGQYDVAADGITITEDRAEIVAFSNGYIAIDQRLLVRADEDRFESIDEFVADETLVSGTQTGTTNYETASGLLPDARIKAFEQFPFAIEALLNGDIDAVFIDETAGQGYQGVNGDALKLTGDSLSSDQLGFVFPLDSDLVEPVNMALDALAADGTLEALAAEYFSSGFEVSYDDIADPSATEGDEGAMDVPDLGGRTVTIAVENAYLPFNYISLETGEPAGWDYEAWDAICGVLNCVPEYVTAGWDGMIQAVSDGQYDVAADGITITEDRAEIVAFSNGYISIDQRLLVRADEARFDSIDAFVADETLVAGTQTGTTNYETASGLLPDERIKAFEQFPFAIEALLNGDIDAVFIDETAGQGYQGVNSEALMLTGDSLSSDQLGFIFPLDSDLVEAVNIALDVLTEDGTLDALAAKYFTDAFAVTYDDIE